MPVFPLSQTARMRPEWWPLHRSDCLVLEAGAVIGPAFHDAPTAYVLLEGEVEFVEAGETMKLEAGEVAAIEPGRAFELRVQSPHCVMFRLEGKPLPPARPGPQPVGSTGTLRVTPLSPKRRGTSILFDESATFSPHLISAAQIGDLMLQMNLGAVAKNQVREIRRSCDEAGRAIAALIIRVEEDEDPVQFLLDRHRWEMARDLKPLHVGVEADLATDKGRIRAEAYRRVWQKKFSQEGVEFIVNVRWRPFAEPEWRELLEYLGHVPPALLPLGIRLPKASLTIAERSALDALTPWLRIVSVPDGDGFRELCHYFDGAGFQGWVLREI